MEDRMLGIYVDVGTSIGLTEAEVVLQYTRLSEQYEPHLPTAEFHRHRTEVLDLQMQSWLEYKIKNKPRG